MAIKKCEKCELNYVKDEEKYCKVCKKLLQGVNSAANKAELCPSCGERLLAKGYELCQVCLSDMLDTVETLEDENGDVIDIDITPADMEISEIAIEEDEEAVPEDIKSDLDEDEEINEDDDLSLDDDD